MGFSSVYKVLRDVFPQVDSRVLRAVAIEHPKDAVAAVEVVLGEVIPVLSKPLATPPSESGSLLSPSEALKADTTAQPDNTVSMEPEHLDGSINAENGENDHVSEDSGDETILLNKCGNSGKVSPDMSSYSTSSASSHESGASDDHDRRCVNSEGVVSLPGKLPTLEYGETGVSGSTNGHLHSDYGDSGDHESILLNKCENNPDMSSYRSSFASAHESGASDDHDQRCGNSEGEVALPGKLPTLEYGETGFSGRVNGHLHSDLGDLDQSASDINGASDQEQSCVNGFPSDTEANKAIVQQAVSPIHDFLLGTEESVLQLVVMPDIQSAYIENPEPTNSSDAASKKDISSSEMVDPEDKSTMNAVITSSSQTCSTDLLEDIVEDARNNKKILISATESVIRMMRELELLEKAAEQAKEEASRGCLDILSKVDELKQALERAKEANDMHSGEVYAEKAILATEMKELQVRLFSLSDERDRSLGILDEMRKELEIKLAAAEKEIEAAVREKVEKEASAREALAYQEQMMEKVVQESKILKQEAEENSKLQEFLMDRGRLVDILQGEISVKCQDVKLLKEKFDKRVPLSKFLSSSQTSCILASSSSSSSSSRSTAPRPEQVPEVAADYQTLKNTTELADSGENNVSSGEEKGRYDDGKVLEDDEWELFNFDHPLTPNDAWLAFNNHDVHA